MSEFQKPYSPNVTEDTYRCIFKNPLPVCTGCFHSWRAKDSLPCKVCTRVPVCLRDFTVSDLGRTDYFTKEYKE